MADDWLLESTRNEQARVRLFQVASALLAEKGVDRFDMSELARRAHCSRATVYRHVGGKSALVEEILTRSSSRIVEKIAEEVEGLTGTERARTALGVALSEVRGDPVAARFFTSTGSVAHTRMLVESRAVTRVAAELIGLPQSDGEHLELAIRTLLSLLWWPPRHDEHRILALLARHLTSEPG